MAEDVICMETFKDYPQLGRFTLRDEGAYAEIVLEVPSTIFNHNNLISGKTVAIGKVLKLVE